jgi:hypothetical protein
MISTVMVVGVTPTSVAQSEGADLMRSADAAEGPRAFAEKRPPRWQAR